MVKVTCQSYRYLYANILFEYPLSPAGDTITIGQRCRVSQIISSDRFVAIIDPTIVDRFRFVVGMEDSCGVEQQLSIRSPMHMLSLSPISCMLTSTVDKSRTVTVHRKSVPILKISVLLTRKS